MYRMINLLEVSIRKVVNILMKKYARIATVNIKVIILSVLCILSFPALGHPNHGLFDLNAWLHYLVEPEHGLIFILLFGLITLMVWQWRKQH